MRAGVVVRVGAGASMLLGPILLMAAFAGHPGFLGVSPLAEDPRAQADADHLVGYSALPFLAVVALTLGRVLYERRPWVALVGGAMTVVGIVFMGGCSQCTWSRSRRSSSRVVRG